MAVNRRFDTSSSALEAQETPDSMETVEGGGGAAAARNWGSSACPAFSPPPSQSGGCCGGIAATLAAADNARARREPTGAKFYWGGFSRLLYFKIPRRHMTPTMPVWGDILLGVHEPQGNSRSWAGDSSTYASAAILARQMRANEGLRRSGAVEMEISRNWPERTSAQFGNFRGLGL
ncbi:uncharacterized protein Triagg1_5093 [Trichoderma aggressivum f. europaeum]|uniref:Uncharacterized protein n=1 Tax=Trichoderma aggressivum f. europaeum TaxID=173218 RepID=A0AAE1IGW5_9HYPO|nr:hypothetical protein Triagg1_5093 [Trichoderma aggressivum f. europaeum]